MPVRGHQVRDDHAPELTGFRIVAGVLVHRRPLVIAVAQPRIRACADTGSTALVGAPVPGTAGREHIGMLAVDGAGTRVAYRKVHVHDSEERFSPGDGPTVLEVDGWRLGLAICRDTRFAEHDAATALLGMDGYVAAVLDHARDAHVPAERAKRVGADHGVWVATASFAGSTGGGFDQAAGGSAVWAPDGTVLAQAGPEPGEIARATLDG